MPGRGKRAAPPLTDYEISPAALREMGPDHASRGPNAMRTRALQIYTLDPSTSPRIGGVATVAVPYEPLEPGPVGRLLEIEQATDPGHSAPPLDLEAPQLLLRSGLTPSPQDLQFPAQMVYAVSRLTYEAFRRALGREITWAVPPDSKGRARLRVRPLAFEGRNAGYSREAGDITYGYFAAHAHAGGFVLPGGEIRTALSHDIIVHETTHALLDALRPSFQVMTRSDVGGFHEGIADLVALFMHFAHPGVVARALEGARGRLTHASLLTDLAQEFGYAGDSRKGGTKPLRSAIDVREIHGYDSDIPPGDAGPTRYAPGMEVHRMGSVLASAVFEAFVTVTRRKTARLLGIAGIDPQALGTVPLRPELLSAIATEAGDLARQFLTICIRAIDYCPPVDMELGEFLRAIITADVEAVPDDPWGYREALMRSFHRRGIFPSGVRFMTQEALLWERPVEPLVIKPLAFGRLRFGRDPGVAASRIELRRRAKAVGEFVSSARVAPLLHLVAPSAPRAKGLAQVGPISVDSVRVARRGSSDGSSRFDLVAEVTQTCTAVAKGQMFEFAGGCTLVIGSEGEVRYAVYKSTDSSSRQAAQLAAMRGPLQRFWSRQKGRYVARPEVFRRLHGGVTAAPPRGGR